MGLDTLKQKLLTMASHAETAVNQALQALAQRDIDLALRVKEDDRIIDQFEVEIDDLVIQLLTKAPLASNLRLVTVAMKISQNLERIGDEASKIAKRARDLAQEPPVKINLDLPRMAGIALEMLRDALDCFVQEDDQKALTVIRRDAEVDNLNRLVYRRLTSFMIERPDTIARALELMFISKSLERIADHATNIAEEMVFLAKGLDIRHSDVGKQTMPPGASAAPFAANPQG